MKPIFFLFAFCVTSLLQAQPGGFDFIEYKRMAKDANGDWQDVGSTRMWYNDTSSYQQNVPPPPVINLSPVGAKATQQDSITIKNHIAESKRLFYARHWFTYRVDSDTSKKVVNFDYDLQPSKVVAYLSRRKKKDSVVFVPNRTMKILGVPCKLAIAYIDNLYNWKDTAHIWYAPGLSSYGPRYYIDLVPGLILRVDGSLETFEARNLEIPATTVGNFDLNARPDQIYSSEEVNKMVKEYHEKVRNAAYGGSK